MRSIRIALIAGAIAVFATGCTVAAVPAAPAAPAPAATHSAPDLTQGFPPCEQEDSTGCYWDASVQGNGVGCSFTTTPNDVVIYWDADACDKFIASQK